MASLTVDEAGALSTLDPARRRHDELESRRGSPSFLLWLCFRFAVFVACAALLGYGLACVADIFRHAVIDTTFADEARFDEAPTWLWWPFGAAFGYVLFGVGMSDDLATFLGRHRCPGIMAAAGWAGVSLGFVVSTMNWWPPSQVGAAIDPITMTETPWSPLAWVGYYTKVWIPLLLLATTGAAVSRTVFRFRRQSAQLEERDRLLVRGLRVPGTIADVNVLVDSPQEDGTVSIAGIDATVTFTDTKGVTRWVTRRVPSLHRVPDQGTTQVLFDPERPGEESSIFVAFHRNPATSDWIPFDWP
ncbi:hypothetical protein [Rhodococcus maanshanensis]|uniref:hypothetical protein n=1 Tax=Rhodococcus maanshanensis TaxID=183556 RepID=UPI0011604D7F|nr:hypothetical protein [Rhodococcus maanshanensis]